MDRMHECAQMHTTWTHLSYYQGHLCFLMSFRMDHDTKCCWVKNSITTHTHCKPIQTHHLLCLSQPSLINFQKKLVWPDQSTTNHYWSIKKHVILRLGLMLLSRWSRKLINDALCICLLSDLDLSNMATAQMQSGNINLALWVKMVAKLMKKGIYWSHLTLVDHNIWDMETGQKPSTD